MRYHNNEDGNDDRLGELQYRWLDQIFSENIDSEITIIGSGIHIIPLRYYSLEEDIG